MKANHIRILLLVTIAIMFISLMGKWEQTFPADNTKQQTSATQNNSHYDNADSSTNTDVTITDAKSSLAKETNFSKYDNAKSITINTVVFKDVKVSLLDGAIISASLKDYSISLDDKTPMSLLTDKSGSEYIAKSTIVVNKQPISVNFEDQGIKIENSKQILTLTGSADGLQITRTYTFDDTKYNISVSQNIKNTTSAPVNVIVDDSFARDFDPAGDSFSLLNAHSYTFTGVAYS
ncbi:membrane protein insertase YidC, partial [Francisella tularensis]